MNLEELRAKIGANDSRAIEEELRKELAEAAQSVSESDSPGIHSAVQETSKWLAEHQSLGEGARRAIEVEWEIRRQQEKAKYPKISITGIDESRWRKADEFPSAYSFVMILSQAPNSEWLDVWRGEFESSWFGGKRSTDIELDRMFVVVSDQDNLQNQVDFAKQVVQRTNERISQILFPRIDQYIEQSKQAALTELDTINSLKAKTRNLRI
jgi:hypothetical protein